MRHLTRRSRGSGDPVLFWEKKSANIVTGFEVISRLLRPAPELYVRIKRKGGIMDPEKIIDGLSKELMFSLKAMSKSKNVNEKEVHSRIVKDLCQSLGVFFDLAHEMMPLDFEGDPDKEDIPF